MRLRRKLRVHFFKKVSGTSSCGHTRPFFRELEVSSRRFSKFVWKREKSQAAPFPQKKKDREINARARALDTKRLAGITFSFHLPSTMIRFILLQNRQGKTRLAKYYVPLEEDEKHQLETEVHRVVVNRDPKHTSFVEFKNHKLVYRRYAGLFFTLCVDANDNELVHLESIHLFVEILDHFFANVCELDLVFNFQKVYVIVDEFILAGEVQETSKKAILNRLAELEQIKG